MLRVSTCLLGVAVTFALASGTADAKELYRWTDEKGVTHYSDTKPVGVEFEKREVAADPAPPPAAAAAQDAATEGDAAKPKGPPSADCLLSRSNLETLRSGRAVSMDTDGDGEPEELDDQMRAQAIVATEEQIRAHCGE